MQPSLRLRVGKGGRHGNIFVGERSCHLTLPLTSLASHDFAGDEHERLDRGSPSKHRCGFGLGIINREAAHRLLRQMQRNEKLAASTVTSERPIVASGSWARRFHIVRHDGAAPELGSEGTGLFSFSRRRCRPDHPGTPFGRAG